MREILGNYSLKGSLHGFSTKYMPKAMKNGLVQSLDGSLPDRPQSE